MKSKYLFVFSVMVLFSIGIVSSHETEIKIKTFPEHEVYLAVLEAGSEEFSVIYIDREFSDDSGNVAFNYTSEESPFDLAVFVNDNGELISSEFREGLKDGEPVFLEVAPEGVDLNKTIEDFQSETPNQNPSFLTGSVVSVDEEFISKNIFYIIVVGGLMFIVLFIGVVLSPKPKHHEIKVRKLSEIQESKPEHESSDEHKGNSEKHGENNDLEEAEKKINEMEKNSGKENSYDKKEKKKSDSD